MAPSDTSPCGSLSNDAAVVLNDLGRDLDWDGTRSLECSAERDNYGGK